ncbi:MAG TPA: hypothetical protein VHU18_01155 [Rhizomicrobium sp.]|jgi:hypothetical protein|nr:hypothetical protein [Rhizomicrobium sp.]
MVEASCHCGAVRVQVPRAPAELKECNCSICRRNGAVMAYYSPKEVHVVPESGATDIYMWGDREIEFHRCKVCGNFTHWSPVDKNLDRMGVNARLMPPELLTDIRILKFDGAGTWTVTGERRGL